MRYFRFALLAMIAAAAAAGIWLMRTASSAAAVAVRSDLRARDAERAAKAAQRTAQEVARYDEIRAIDDVQLDRELRDIRAKAAAARKSN